MPKVDVYCTIDNCQWWGDGNHCTASKILITHDSIGEEYADDVDAPDVQMIVSERGETPADSCMQTCCKTFVAK